MMAARRVDQTETELAAQDEQALLADAWAAFNAGVCKGGADMDPLPPPPQLNRVVILNWKAEQGFIPIGNVELELDPGQKVTVWIDASRSVPQLVDRPERSALPGTLAILCDDEPLLG
jgi:hypothetical protein